LVEVVFVARVITGGKVTIPKRIRNLLHIEEGDYVRVSLLEVVKKKADVSRMESRSEREKTRT